MAIQMGLALAGVSVGARAEVVEIVTVAETSLIEAFPTNNLGGQNYVTCGNIQNAWCGTISEPIFCRNRALLKFDIAGAVPPGSRIRSIRLVLWMSFASQDPEANPLDLSIHRMLVPWLPGTGTNDPMLFPGILGRPALAGEPCWDYRSYPDVPWGLPGGAPGADYRAEASGGISGISNTPNEIYSIEVGDGPLLEDVQFWLDHPAANHGWMLKGADETQHWTAKRFLTPDVGGDYPRMEINYVPPPAIENFQLSSGVVTFSFLADTEQPYVVETTTHPAMAWSNLVTYPSFLEATNVLVVDDAPGASNRYYRVVAPAP